LRPCVLDSFDLRQRLLAALDNGGLAVLRAKALNEPLLACHLALLASCRAVLLLQPRGLLSLILAVVAAVALDRLFPKFQDSRGHAVKKFAIVRDYKNCAAVVAQLFGEPVA